MLNDNPRTDTEKKERLLKGLKQVNFSFNHPHFLKKAIVKKPRFVPKWACRWFDKNIGKEGIVVFVEIGEYSQEEIYSLLFDEELPGFNTGYYFEKDLEFHLPDMLTERERQMLGLHMLNG